MVSFYWYNSFIVSDLKSFIQQILTSSIWKKIGFVENIFYLVLLWKYDLSIWNKDKADDYVVKSQVFLYTNILAPNNVSQIWC